MRQLLRKSRIVLLIGIPALLACRNSTSPGDTVVGDYTALFFFTTPSGGSTRNERQAGSSLTLTLNPNGTTSGHLRIAANGSTAALDADMAGTWTQNGEVVEFTQAADTFVSDMVFTIERVSVSVAYLVGDQVFSGTRFNLTLAHVS
jgi:hypothetical protein